MRSPFMSSEEYFAADATTLYVFYDVVRGSVLWWSLGSGETRTHHKREKGRAWGDIT